MEFTREVIIPSGKLEELDCIPFLSLVSPSFHRRREKYREELIMAKTKKTTEEEKRIDEALSKLPVSEARVISLRYGLEDGKTHTRIEIAKEFSVTEERVRQYEEEALENLRLELGDEVRKYFHD